MDEEPADKPDADSVTAKVRKMLAENRAMTEENRALMAKIKNDLKCPPPKEKAKI